MKFLTAYGPRFAGAVIDCGDVVITKQAMRDECNINLIVARFVKTGLVTHLASGRPSFSDVSEVSDFRQALDHVMQVEAFFMGLPSAARAGFQNDPATFLDAINDPSKLSLFEELGLSTLVEPPEAPPSDPPASDPPSGGSGDGGSSNEP